MRFHWFSPRCFNQLRILRWFEVCECKTDDVWMNGESEKFAPWSIHQAEEREAARVDAGTAHRAAGRLQRRDALLTEFGGRIRRFGPHRAPLVETAASTAETAPLSVEVSTSLQSLQGSCNSCECMLHAPKFSHEPRSGQSFMVCPQDVLLSGSFCGTCAFLSSQTARFN